MASVSKLAEDWADRLGATAATELTRAGWIVLKEAIPAPLWREMAARLERLAASGALEAATVGRERAPVPGRRGDRIAWASGDAAGLPEAEFLAAMDRLRRSLNRSLYLGLEAFEGHYAEYSPGARYERHRDVFRDDDSRVLSVVTYLNEEWGARDGGELVLYPPGGAPVRVAPSGGTLTLFLSRETWHEVRPAARRRLSFAGWFRVRSLPTP